MLAVALCMLGGALIGTGAFSAVADWPYPTKYSPIMLAVGAMSIFLGILVS